MARKASRTSFEFLTNSYDELALTSKRRGFTIVELLIVIVVIAILAAITAVAYTGIRERAALSALQSELSQQARQLAVWRAQNNDLYPTTLAAARAAGMLNDASGTAYTKYVVNNSTNPANYCATGVKSGVSYSVSSTSSSPIVGECVTNLIGNPSPASTAGYGSTGNHTLTWVNSANAVGGSGFVAATANSGNGDVRAPVFNLTLSNSTTYTYTAFVRYRSGDASTASASTIKYDDWGSLGGSGNSCALTSGMNWCRVWRRFTTPASLPSQGVALNTTHGAVNTSMDTANWMLVEGADTTSYGDGASPGWFWNGAPNNSTSTGPAIVQ